MDKIIVYFDDPAYAQQQLVPMAVGVASLDRVEPTHWVLVACPPRMTRHIGRWVSYGARESWRAQWAEKAFIRIAPQLQARSDEVTLVLAKGVLVELTKTLAARYGAARVFDARRPKFGRNLPPVTASQPLATDHRWEGPGAIASMGMLLMLAAE
jgi:hypothetical protein